LTKQRVNEVKVEEPHQSPVDTSDKDQDKGNPVNGIPFFHVILLVVVLRAHMSSTAPLIITDK
jgi:hypothetical protein